VRSPTQTEAVEAYAGKAVLITGGLGFMGLNLARALKAVDARLRILSRSWPVEVGDIGSVLQGTAFFKGDIRDSAVVEQAVAGAEVIFHLAGKSGPSASNTSPLEDLDVNGRGQLILLEACRRHSPAAKIVYPSSRLVYAPSAKLPVNENCPTQPLSVYGVHKLAGERYLLLYQRLYGLRSSVLRISNPYGPFQRPEQNRYGIINWFIHLAMRGRHLTVYGDGAQLRDYIHVDDVVRAMLIAGVAADADGEVLNIGSSHGVSFADMATLVVRSAGRGRVKHVEWPEDDARVETGDFVADTTLAKRVLGWQTAVPLESGIADVVSRYTELMAARP
jgi:nucleoside-diphosphate-sugar epimerase